MQLPFQDALAALDQLAAATSSETHRLALQVAMDAVHFQHAIESTLERHALESLRRSGPALPLTRPLEKWSLDEDVQLRLEFESGMTLDVIAAQHVRSPLEVAERLHKPLGLLTEQAVEEIRVARNRQRAKYDYESGAGDEAFDPEMEEATHGAVDLSDELLADVAMPAAESATAPAPVSALSAAPVVGVAVVAEVIPTPVVAEPPVATASAPAVQVAPMTPVVPVAPVVLVAPIVAPVAAPTIAPETPTAAQPAPTQATNPIPAEAPVAAITPPSAVAAAVVVPVPEVIPVTSGAPSAPIAPAPVPATADGKPVLTPEEESTVAQIMAKYNSKNAPKNAVRDYVKSERFAVKVRSEVQTWLLAELIRLA